MGLDISHGDGVTTVDAEGAVDLARIRTMLEEIQAALGSGAVPRLLIIDRGTTFVPFTKELKELVGMFEDSLGDGDARIAVIAERAAQYGVARMFQARSEMASFTARAFRPGQEEAARAWLQGESTDG